MPEKMWQAPAVLPDGHFLLPDKLQSVVELELAC